MRNILKSKKELKSNKGITLVALIITVILMLILAGVAISVVIDGDGLFRKSREATKAYENSAQDENKTISNLMNYIDRYLGENFSENNSTSEETEIIEEVTIDDELQRLLNEANIVLSLEDIINTPAIVENLVGVIPTITSSDVTRSVDDSGIINYTDTKGGVTRTNSNEWSTNYAWKAFDNDLSTISSTSGYSDRGGTPGDYYVEYEFPEKVYAFKTKFKITNFAASSGTRGIIVQGYNEETLGWENLTEQMSQTGTEGTFPETIKDLDYSKPYKRYRLYINSATGTGNGWTDSGIYVFQLYGIFTDNLNKYSEKEKIDRLLSGSSIKTITLDHMITNTEFIERLINELSVETVLNNQKLIDNPLSLIPALASTDVTRSVDDSGIINYTDTKGGVTRTNSNEWSTNYAWKAFDNDLSTISSTSGYSDRGGTPGDYYVEYEFPEKVYAFKTKFKITNASTTSSGTRGIIVQGYNEETSGWENLTEQMSQTGMHGTFPETIKDLNYSKPYKRYRLYINSATGGGNGWTDSGIYEFQLYGKKY